MTDQMVETSHCRIAVTESAGEGPVVLMIHGNSSCKEVFRNQLEGPLGARFRLVAMDLPGHGASEDAPAPDRSYCLTGYAEAAAEVMEALGYQDYAVYGWSLGGHIGIEMMARGEGRDGGVSGLMISGTPPIASTPEGMAEGFVPSPHMHLTGKEEFTEEEAMAYGRATCGDNAPFEDFLYEGVKRTDGRARATMIAKLAEATHADQQQAAVNSPVPLAIVNGAEDAFVNNAFIAGLPYGNLWQEVLLLDGVGHAPFWEAPDRFDPVITAFVESLPA